MILKTVGLKTHIWNNNLKALLFFIFYPIFITPVWVMASFFGLIVMFFASAFYGNEIGISSGYNGYSDYVSSNDYNFSDIFSAIVFNLWWVPYVILLVYLLMSYYKLRNNLNVRYKVAITRKSNEKFYNLLENLCISRGVKTPLLFVKNDSEINSYSFGLTKHTTYIVVTSGALAQLDEEELQVMLAHELAQILNNDTRLLYLTGLMSYFFTTLADASFGDTEKINSRGSLYRSIEAEAEASMFPLVGFIFGMIFSVGIFGARMARFFLSRRVQYIADAGAIELTKNPDALISLLLKIGQDVQLNKKNPVKKPMYFHHDKRPEEFLRSHPKIEDRINKIIEVCNLYDIELTELNRRK